VASSGDTQGVPATNGDSAVDASRMQVGGGGMNAPLLRAREEGGAKFKFASLTNSAGEACLV